MRRAAKVWLSASIRSGMLRHDARPVFAGRGGHAASKSVVGIRCRPPSADNRRTQSRSPRVGLSVNIGARGGGIKGIATGHMLLVELYSSSLSFGWVGAYPLPISCAEVETTPPGLGTSPAATGPPPLSGLSGRRRTSLPLCTNEKNTVILVKTPSS